jgi:hypothetical protein
MEVSLAKNRPVLTLRYEDMLAAPVRTFARLASYLRMRPSAEQLRRAIEKSSFVELARQEEVHGFIERPKTAAKFFRAGAAGQWKAALSQKQVNAIVQTHAPMMMRFGYLRANCGDKRRSASSDQQRHEFGTVES